MRNLQASIILLVMWAVALFFFVTGANRQRTHLNLSATAGGQYPYLVYAKGMAEHGWFGHLGDRNRMPFVPALLSLVYDSDWNTFVDRAGKFAIGLSLLGVLIVAIACHWALPTWSATATALFAMFGVFLPTAAFVQADRLYCALFFVCWLLFCKLLRMPNALLAIIAGVLSGVCFLVKASVTPLLVLFGLVALVPRFAPRRTHGTVRHTGTMGRRPPVVIACLFVGFFAVTFPYLLTSKQQFGRFYYNVNTTYYLWCDNWREAKAFGDRYHAEKQAPTAPEEVTPSPARYWRTHSLSQMAKRVWAGCKTLTVQGVQNRANWAIGAAGVIALALVLMRRTGLAVLHAERALIVFSVAVISAYFLAYSWYAQIAYGDRFMASLLLPTLGGLFWLMHQLDRAVRQPELPAPPPAGEIAAGWLAVVILANGVYTAKCGAHAADRPFIQFYFEETRERELADDLSEAKAGYAGVLALDSAFVPALHGLGMIALQQEHFAEASELLGRAVALEPDSADLHNSLGSALVQQDRAVDALSHFERATQLDPRSASAWFNLGGTYVVLGELDEARRVVDTLEAIDMRVAQQLEGLIPR